MYYYRKLAIIGFLIGVFPTILGIIALATSPWIIVNQGTSSNRTDYSLFGSCKTNNITDGTNTDLFKTPRYLEIMGFITLLIGLFIGIFCMAFLQKHSIHFIAPIILIIGIGTILLGLIFYIKSVAESASPRSIIHLQLGYSMILMITTCMIGFVSIAYFSYTAGYIHRHILSAANLH